MKKEQGENMDSLVKRGTPLTATRVCLVIPVFNEEKNLPVLHKEIQRAMTRQSRDWRVLYVDDASTDASLAVIQEIAEADPRVHYLAFAENRGQSAAFAAGFGEGAQTLGADALITLDADLQNDPADIPGLLNLYDAGYDMVTGWRANRQDTPLKRYASRFANALRNILTRENVRDTGCSLKVLRASMALELPVFRGMHRFLPTLMKMKGAIVAEAKVNHRPRLHGDSKYGIWDRAFSGLADLLAVRWMQKRYISYKIKDKK